VLSWRSAPEGLLRFDRTGIDGRCLLFALAASMVSACSSEWSPACGIARYAEALAGSRVPHRRTFFSRLLLVSRAGSDFPRSTTGAGAIFFAACGNLQTNHSGIRPGYVTASSRCRNTACGPEGRRRPSFHDLDARLKICAGGGLLRDKCSIPPRGSMGRPIPYPDGSRHMARSRADGGMVEFRG